MVNRQADEGDIKTVALSKTGGGAFVAVTKQCIVVGSYLKDQDMSAGGKQNIGSTTANVLSVAKTLSEAGYWISFRTCYYKKIVNIHTLFSINWDIKFWLHF